MNRIEVKGVTKRYRDVTALADVSLTFEAEKIYGLLGRNGAGKSTLLNTISNRVFPTSGEVFINGMPAMENDAAQNLIYLMSEKDYYIPQMKVADAFRWTKEFYGSFDAQRATQMAGQFGLNIQKKVSKLSTGYKSIYKNIIALCVDVPFVFLDEPVLGLDANHRELFYKLLLETYAEKPRTFIISTHLIEEVSKIVEHIIIIKHGQVIEDAPCELLMQSGYSVAGPAPLVTAYCEGRQVIGQDTLGGMVICFLLGDPPTKTDDRLTFSTMDLQKRFIQLTND